MTIFRSFSTVPTVLAVSCTQCTGRARVVSTTCGRLATTVYSSTKAPSGPNSAP